MDLTMPSTRSETTPAHSWRFDALGTAWEIVSKHLISKQAMERIAHEISLFEHTYSRFINDSLVSTVARIPGTYTFPDSAEEIFAYYEELFKLTNGKVTPLVGDALASAGYSADYSLKPLKDIHSVARYDQEIQRDRRTITVRRPLALDIGAVGKGYAVDRVVSLLLDEGHVAFVVDASGDMRAVGDIVEVVGLENPHNFEEVIGAIELKDKALCASASNRRAWGDWHHVIDPETSKPTRQIVATWVIADTAMVADGLATALFFVSPQTLLSQYNYEYMRVHADGSVEYSDYFAEGVFE